MEHGLGDVIQDVSRGGDRQGVGWMTLKTDFGLEVLCTNRKLMGRLLLYGNPQETPNILPEV